MSKWPEWVLERVVLVYYGALATLAFIPILIICWALDRRDGDEE